MRTGVPVRVRRLEIASELGPTVLSTERLTATLPGGIQLVARFDSWDVPMGYVYEYAKR